MKKLTPFVGLILVVGLPTQAQSEYPKMEIFGGLTYAHAAGGVDPVDFPEEHFSGWQSSLSINREENWGFFIELSRQRAGDASIHHFLLGPRHTLRHSKVTGFIHIGVGLQVIPNDAFPGLALGGGLDLNVNERISLRVIQYDYLPTYLNARLGFGVVLKLGSGP